MSHTYAQEIAANLERAPAQDPMFQEPGFHRMVAAAKSIERVGFPVAFTAFTTAAGFLSLTVNDLEVIREFGLYSSVGIAASLAAALGVQLGQR